LVNSLFAFFSVEVLTSVEIFLETQTGLGLCVPEHADHLLLDSYSGLQPASRSHAPVPYTAIQQSSELAQLPGNNSLHSCAPTREIQRMLVDMKDKQSSFVGSREWIGAIEIQMCLDKLYGVRMMWWWSWWRLVSSSAAAHDTTFGANRPSCRARSCV
jgi:hypothetical protein